jgi:flagellar hook-basal body complex protein FliE
MIWLNATGDLSSIHDYTIAAAEASTATQLAVSLRNTGLQAFNQIMSLQI